MDAKLVEEINKELELTFCAETAYLSYVPLARLLGGMNMDQILGDNDIVWRLSSQVSESSRDTKSTVCCNILTLHTRLFCAGSSLM